VDGDLVCGLRGRGEHGRGYEVLNGAVAGEVMTYIGSGGRIAPMAGLYNLGYISNAAHAFFSLASGLPFSSLGGYHYLLCPMRAIPLTQTSFGDSHIYPVPREV
jgi:hypothetical protein